MDFESQTDDITRWLLCIIWSSVMMEVLEVESCIHGRHVCMTSGVQKQENYHVCLPCGFVGSDFTMTVVFCITFNF